jgi:nucleotide-binding universal stress UspA family protein
MAEICPREGVEKILLATDGSEYSEGAVREAIRLASKCSSKLTALSVMEANPEFDAIAPQFLEQKEKEARINLEAVQARARKEGIECDILVGTGDES